MPHAEQEESGIFVPLDPEVLAALGGLVLVDGKLQEQLAKEFIEEGLTRRAMQIAQEHNIDIDGIMRLRQSSSEEIFRELTEGDDLTDPNGPEEPQQ